MLGDLGQEPDARLQRGAGYQAQRGLVQVGARGKRRILAGVNQRVHNRSFRCRWIAANSSSSCGGTGRPYVVQAKVVCSGGPAGVGRMGGSGVAAGAVLGPSPLSGVPAAGSDGGRSGSPLLSGDGDTSLCLTSTSITKTGRGRGSRLASACMHAAGVAPMSDRIWVSGPREVPRCRSGRS